MANKVVKFNTKIINDSKIYLKASDVAKALGYSKQQDFISEHPSIVEKISGIQCVRETAYNNLLAENKEALLRQGQIEITSVNSLRSKIDIVMDVQGLKLFLARDYLQMMADRTGCGSKQEYIVKFELPKEKRNALKELVHTENDHLNYDRMVEYLQDKESFDIDKIRSYGLDVQYLVSINCIGRVDVDAYVIGRGVFYRVTDMGDYAFWNDIYADENGDIILPYCNYDSSCPEERQINLSKPDVDHDFREGNVVKNMIWCIQNLNVNALEDYEYEVFGYSGDTINFQMGIDLLAKIIKPDAVDTIYTDRLIDLETFQYITEFDSERVFMEDIIG